MKLLSRREAPSEKEIHSWMGRKVTWGRSRIPKGADFTQLALGGGDLGLAVQDYMLFSEGLCTAYCDDVILNWQVLRFPFYSHNFLFWHNFRPAEKLQE